MTSNVDGTAFASLYHWNGIQLQFPGNHKQEAVLVLTISCVICVQVIWQIAMASHPKLSGNCLIQAAMSLATYLTIMPAEQSQGLRPSGTGELAASMDTCSDLHLASTTTWCSTASGRTWPEQKSWQLCTRCELHPHSLM